MNLTVYEVERWIEQQICLQLCLLCICGPFLLSFHDLFKGYCTSKIKLVILDSRELLFIALLAILPYLHHKFLIDVSWRPPACTLVRHCSHLVDLCQILQIDLLDADFGDGPHLSPRPRRLPLLDVVQLGDHPHMTSAMGVWRRESSQKQMK